MFFSKIQQALTFKNVTSNDTGMQVSIWCISEKVLHRGGTSGPLWPIHLLEFTVCTASPSSLPPCRRLSEWRWFAARWSALSPPMGLILRNLLFELLQRQCRNKAAERGGAMRDPLFLWAFSSDASSSTFFCSPPLRSVFHPQSVSFVFCSVLRSGSRWRG